jgi:hypothetical protein
MDPKLTILLALIASIVGFSHLRDEKLARLQQIVVRRGWSLRRTLKG